MNIKRRNPNFEMLRILSMLFIIANHCILNVATPEYQAQQVKGFNFILTDILYQAAYVAVNCYVLISGYFLVGNNKCNFNFHKVMKLWSVVFFYSVSIYAICVLGLKLQPLALKDIVHVLLPIHYDLYWFITQYMALFLISPFLIKAANCMSRESYRNLLIISFFIVSILQLSGLKGGFSLLWFIFLFMFAGYIRIYNPRHFIKKHPLASYITMTCILAFISIVGGYHQSQLSIVSYLGFYNGPFIFVSSISLFYVFKEMKTLKENNWIVKATFFFAPACFGIYLIHEHPYLKDYLWENVLNLALSLHEVNVLFVLFISIVLFIVCALIEKMRIFMFKLIQIDNGIAFISNKMVDFYSNIKKLWQNR